MKTVIFTPRQWEYQKLGGLIAQFCGTDSGPPEMEHYETIEPFHLNMRREADFCCDLVVVALDGAEGMECVLDLRTRLPDLPVIWMTDDRYFAGIALRSHVHDFLLRPISETRLKEALERAGLM